MIEAEIAILGSVLLEPSCIHKAISDGLNELHFGSIPNKRIWRSMTELAHDSTEVNQVTLANHLQSRGALDSVGGYEYLSTLDADFPDPNSMGDYVTVVKGAAFRRSVANLGATIQSLHRRTFTDEQLLEEVHRLVAETASTLTSGAKTTTAESLVNKLVEKLEDQTLDQGISSGYPVVDMLLGGYRRGNLVILAGRPGMGKTSLALNQAHIQSTRHKKRVGIFSMEMSGEEIITKILAAETGIAVTKIRASAFGEAEWYKIAKARRNISKFPMYIDETGGLSIEQLQAKAREMVNVHGVDIIYIDYLQLMGATSKAGNRTEEVSHISRGLKSLAKELDIPVVALSQLSRAVEQRPDKRPVLSDLRESGGIEQDADSVMFVYRPGVYQNIDTTSGETELILSKNRHGATGVIPLVWEAGTNQFHSED